MEIGQERNQNKYGPFERQWNFDVPLTKLISKICEIKSIAKLLRILIGDKLNLTEETKNFRTIITKCTAEYGLTIRTKLIFLKRHS